MTAKDMPMVSYDTPPTRLGVPSRGYISPMATVSVNGLSVTAVAKSYAHGDRDRLIVIANLEARLAQAVKGVCVSFRGGSTLLDAIDRRTMPACTRCAIRASARYGGSLVRRKVDRVSAPRLEASLPRA